MAEKKTLSHIKCESVGVAIWSLMEQPLPGVGKHITNCALLIEYMPEISATTPSL